MVDWSFSKRKKDEEEELRGVISCYVTMAMERKKNIFELIFFLLILFSFTAIDREITEERKLFKLLLILPFLAIKKYLCLFRLKNIKSIAQSK